MWNYLRNQAVHKVLILLVVDLCLLLLAIYGGYVIKFSVRSFRLSLDLALQRANLFLIISVFSHVMFLYLYGLYSVVRPWAPMRLFFSTLSAIITSTAFLMVLQFFVPGYWIGRVVLTIQIPLCVAVLYLWRTGFYKSRLSWTNRKRLALVGYPDFIEEFLTHAAPALSFRYAIHGICPTRISRSWFPSQSGNLRVYRGVEELLVDPQVEALAFQFMDPGLTREDLRALLHKSCQGMEVSDLITLYKSVTGKVPVSYVDEGWLVSHLGMQGGPSPYYLKTKRLLDVSISALALAVLMPLMGLVALLVRLDSPGPALFRQERLGRFRRPFECLKFRTMVVGAESGTGPVWSRPDDPRITRVGKWLRRLRLDELPQFMNVLKGDMSLIGPRPIRAHFADQLAREIPLYELRFALRPGLTGWAQVNHSYADSQESQIEKFEYELFYIQNASFLLDAMILVMTLRTLFLRKGQ